LELFVKRSLNQLFAGLKYLPDRTPDMAFGGNISDAFAEVTPYRDGAMYIGYYSGTSEWERHPSGDELVLALEGSTTLVLLRATGEERVHLAPMELVVVPAKTWHRFEGSDRLKILTVTPQPTDHSLETPHG
jgi:mannose-6-phosphate isomerase-like protein (cupin superfamily)